MKKSTIKEIAIPNRPQSAHGNIKYCIDCILFFWLRIAIMIPIGIHAAKDVNRTATLMPPKTKAATARRRRDGGWVVEVSW